MLLLNLFMDFNDHHGKFFHKTHQQLCQKTYTRVPGSLQQEVGSLTIWHVREIHITSLHVNVPKLNNTARGSSGIWEDNC